MPVSAGKKAVQKFAGLRLAGGKLRGLREDGTEAARLAISPTEQYQTEQDE